MSQLCLLPAGSPELVRSNQKDRFYVDRVTAYLSDISRQVLPLRVWLRWQRELHLLAELGYYSLTTLLDNQTLGEEYTNTIQARTQTNIATSLPVHTPAGFLRRTLAILIQTLGPYVIERALEVAYKRINDRSLHSINLSEDQYQVLESVVGFVEELVSTCNRLHLALFYLRGIFYHFGKRVSGIRYVMVRYGMDNHGDLNAPMSTYRILGWIILLQLMFKMVKLLWDYSKSKQNLSPHLRTNTGSELSPSGPRILLESQRQDDGCIEKSSSLKCPLCLEMCQSQTATLCGHIFCWKCVSEWVSEKSECPICRSSVNPQQLICLQHFEC